MGSFRCEAAIRVSTGLTLLLLLVVQEKACPWLLRATAKDAESAPLNPDLKNAAAQPCDMTDGAGAATAAASHAAAGPRCARVGMGEDEPGESDQPDSDDPVPKPLSLHATLPVGYAQRARLLPHAHRAAACATLVAHAGTHGPPPGFVGPELRDAAWGDLDFGPAASSLLEPGYPCEFNHPLRRLASSIQRTGPPLI